MAKESRTDRWPYQVDAVARQPAVSPPQAVLAFPDPDLSEIARSARSSLKAAAVAIAVDTAEGRVCRARAGESAPDLGAPVRRDRGITGECVSTASVICCPDTAKHPGVDRALCERLGVRSILAAPMLHGGAVVGVIVTFFPVRYAYSDVTVTHLEEFAREAVERLFGEQMPSPAPAAEPATIAPPAEVSPLPETTDVVPSAEEPAPDISQTKQRIRQAIPWIAAYVAIAVIASALLLLFNADSKRASPEPRPAATLERTRTAAEAGDLDAEYALAHAYRDGTGVAADPAEAQKWLRRAAEGGNADAQLELAALLEHDQAAQPVEAYTWYVIAWQAGKRDAQNAIHRLAPRFSRPEMAQVRYVVAKEYALGRALPHDAVSAYVWYALAESGGETKARARLRELESQLTPAQLAQAKSRVATWIHGSPNADVSRAIGASVDRFGRSPRTEQ